MLNAHPTTPTKLITRLQRGVRQFAANAQKLATSLRSRVRNAGPKRVVAITGIVVVFVLVGLSGLTMLAANAVGSSNVLSPVARLVPLEQVQLLSSFRKSDQQLVTDATSQFLDASRAAREQGEKRMTTLTLKTSGEETARHLPFTVAGQMVINSVLNAQGNLSESHVKIQGKYASGGLSFETGDEGVVLDFLNKNTQEMYGKLHLSSEVLDGLMLRYIVPAATEEDSEKRRASITKYLDKYYYINIPKYQEMQAEMYDRRMAQFSKFFRTQESPTVRQDMTKVFASGEEFVNKIKPDLITVIQKNLSQVQSYADIQLEPRQLVQKKSMIVLRVSIKEEELGKVIAQTVRGLRDSIISHRDDVIAYCEASSAPSIYSPNCAAEFRTLETATDEVLSKHLDQTISTFLDLISFENVRLYIDPATNALSKIDLDIVANPEAIERHMGKALHFNELRVALSSEQTQAGGITEFTPPADAANLTDAVRQDLEEQLKKDEEYVKKMMRY